MFGDTVADAPKRFFICYRRERDSYPAALLYQRLSSEFGESQVFKDVDNVRPGDDFVRRMTEAVAACGVLLVLIGPGWAQATAEHGQGLENPADFVRLEIETALERRVRIIPVLVGNARMPLAEELPESLRPLVHRQAHELSPTRSGRDTDELVAALREEFNRRPAPLMPEPPPPPAQSPLVWSPDSPVVGGSVNVAGGISGTSRRVVLVLVLVLVAGLGLAVPSWRGGFGGRSVGDKGVVLPQSATPLANDVLVWRRERGGSWGIGTISAEGVEGPEIVAGARDSSAVISRDRRTVLYLRSDGRERKSLRAVSVDGEEDRQLFSDGSADCPTLRRPAWSVDGVLAVVCSSETKPDALVLMALDGRVIRRLDQGNLGDPTFARGGQSVVYWANRTRDEVDGGALFEVAVDGTSAPIRLTDGGDGVDADPAISPDGLRVAFRHGRGGERRIELLSLGATAGTRTDRVALTSGGWDQSPSWSPDGSKIAFNRGSQASANMYVVSVDDSTVRWIIANPDPVTPPVWTTR